MTTLGRILAITVGVVLALFAISNRQVVTLSIWPLPVTVDAPVYLVILLTLLIGFLLGLLINWGQVLVRGQAIRRQERTLKTLHKASNAKDTGSSEP